MIVLSVLLILVLVGILCGLTLGLYSTSRIFSIIFFALGSCAAVKYLSSGERPKGEQRRQPRFQQPRVPHISRERQEPKAPASREDTVLTEKTVDRAGRSENSNPLFRQAPAVSVPQTPKAKASENDALTLAPPQGRRQPMGNYEVILPGMTRSAGYELILTANQNGIFHAELWDEKVSVTLSTNPLEGAGVNLSRYGIQDLFSLRDDPTNRALESMPTGRVSLMVTRAAVCQRHGDGQLALVQKGIVSVTANNKERS